MTQTQQPLVGIIMGSTSDLDVMAGAAEVLDLFAVPHEIRIISAHRTPGVMVTYAATAQERGLQTIIAGAGGSAHLPGMTASHTSLPVIGVPVKRDSHDHEALWSNIKMPPGIPLATMPENGAKNAALFAIKLLSLHNAGLRERYEDFRKKQHDQVAEEDKKLQRLGWKEYLQT